ncbi:MAG: hypothetical protein KY468_09610 [Armatimonadetes bacterium]|nr:hypothetical protein [Armatimonadota bacterium]
MHHQPLIEILYANQAQVLGLNRQQKKKFGFDVPTLAGKEADLQHLFIEGMTGQLALAPVVRYRDLGTANVTHAPGDQGIWRETIPEHLHKKVLIQRKTEANSVWNAETQASWLPVDNQPFVIELYYGASPDLGAEPKAGIEDVYRRVTWCSDSAAGENRYRVTFPYGEDPYLEVSADQGATWKNLGGIPCPMDMTELRTSRNIRLSLTVWPLDGEILIWLGQGLNRFSKKVAGSYKAGKLKFEGKNAFAVIGYGDLRFGGELYFDTDGNPRVKGTLRVPKERGPEDMESIEPVFQISGKKAAGQEYTAALGTVDTVAKTFDYTVTMSAPAISEAEPYAATTPTISHVGGYWPLLYDPPADPVVWTPLTGIHRYDEALSWNPGTRMLSRRFTVVLDNTRSQNRALGGLIVIRIRTGYAHMAGQPGFDAQGLCNVPRGYALARVNVKWNSNGAESYATIEAVDFSYILMDQTIPARIYPARNCIYAVLHHLLEIGGIVPELAQRIPSCTLGPDPTVLWDPEHPVGAACPHTKFGAHPGWEMLNPLMACIQECMAAEHATFGVDAFGQFVFHPFDPDLPYALYKIFTEAGTDGNYDKIVSHGLHQGTEGGLVRRRSLDPVFNAAELGGIDEATGEVIASVEEDLDSIAGDPAFPNALGFRRALREASSIFSNQEFMDGVREKTFKWARLPEERIDPLPAHGQPELQPWDSIDGGLMVIGAQERRVLGTIPYPYFLTDVVSTILSPSMAARLGSPYQYLSTIYGTWTGSSEPPGTI